MEELENINTNKPPEEAHMQRRHQLLPKENKPTHSPHVSTSHRPNHHDSVASLLSSANTFCAILAPCLIRLITKIDLLTSMNTATNILVSKPNQDLVLPTAVYLQ